MIAMATPAIFVAVVVKMLPERHTMTNLPARLRFHGRDMPWCIQCDRPVETVKWETPVETIFIRSYEVRYVHTGEIIVSVECHGERWRASNWRGEF